MHRPLAAAAAFLKAELLHLRLGRVEVAVRRHHALALVLIAVAAILIFAVGIFVGYEYPYKTLPAPKVPPGEIQPQCPTLPGKVSPSEDHSLGQCLPEPKAKAQSSSIGPGGPSIERAAFERVVSITRSSSGPDLSNNDPIFSDGSWAAIAARNSFEIDKVIEGTGFIDRTAAAMAAAAKRHGLVVGGYDFLHVCLTSPTAEAHLFVVMLRADGLTGKGTLPGTGDAEYPSSPQCNVRAWISAWVTQVHREDGRWPMIYTGAWWWDPHVGAWWYGNLTAWISGYVRSLSSVPRPAGRGHIDLWQLSDHGFNGATSVDLSVWLNGARAFATLTDGTVARPVDRYAVFPKTAFRFGHPGICISVSTCAPPDHASEYNTARTWDRSRCKNPVRRPVCKSSRYHLRLLRDRAIFVEHHQLGANGWIATAPRLGFNHLDARIKGLSRRIG